jgi:hypothetical protein
MMVNFRKKLRDFLFALIDLPRKLPETSRELGFLQKSITRNGTNEKINKVCNFSGNRRGNRFHTPFT